MFLQCQTAWDHRDTVETENQATTGLFMGSWGFGHPCGELLEVPESSCELGLIYTACAGGTIKVYNQGGFATLNYEAQRIRRTEADNASVI